MTPPFDLQGGFWLASVRDITVTALLSAFGTLIFRVVVVPRAFARASDYVEAGVKRRLLLITQASAAAALMGGIAWLGVQSADFADADTTGQLMAAIPKVVADTMFGHVIIAQLALLLLLPLALGLRDQAWRQKMALAIATLALCLEAGHSHAASMDVGPSWLLAADILHLLGAGAWLGGLLPLLLTVRHAPPVFGAQSARWFSPMGKICLAALLVSATYQGWVLIASIPGLVGTAYGWMALVKTALFGVLFCFALANRYRFAPALHGDHPEQARTNLFRSIVLQTGFALAIIVAAVVLSGLPPAMHVQPIWPFARQFSLDAINEDPDFRNEVVQAALVLGAALVLLALALAMRRFRLPALATACIAAWFTVPHFDLLLADATPTSFYHSPTGFSSEAIVAGQALFARNCVACHGAGGMGDGPLAKTLPVPPANLTAAHLWMHSDGQMFWWLTSGIRTPEGKQAMPGFVHALGEDQRWALIDYVRANNAGTAFHATGTWPHPVQAPGLNALCDGHTVQLSDLHGRFIRLVIGPVTQALPAAPGLVTISTADAGAPEGVCTVRDENVPAAYAIVAGATLAPGTQFLIDGDGWLRAMQPGGWQDTKTLEAEIAALREHPASAVAMPMPMDMKM